MSEIDFSGPIPVYRQLADLIRARIEDGTYPPRTAVPSKRRLREEFGFGGPTIDRAMAILKEEGLVEFAAGKGLYVTSRA